MSEYSFTLTCDGDCLTAEDIGAPPEVAHGSMIAYTDPLCSEHGRAES